MIFSTLKRGSWNRKALRPDSPKRAMYEARIEAGRAAKARDKALTFGCEYRSVFLAGVFKRDGCAACGNEDPRGFHSHHVIHRSRKGRANDLVHLCPACHIEDGKGSVDLSTRRCSAVTFCRGTSECSTSFVVLGR